jgi:class 3 adenylate cyclase/pimeloyl-ACP methyl ester carboxylesterase
MDAPRIQYARTTDGVNIAYWTMGQGYPLIQSTGAPFNHIQLEFSFPDYRDRYVEYARRFQLIRFDGRGSGLSDREVDDVSIEAQALDIEAVAGRLGLDRYALLVSQGTTIPAVVLAARNPERISHLMLTDSFTNGRTYLQNSKTKVFRAMMEADWEMFSETLSGLFYGWSGGEEARRLAAFVRECVDQRQCIAYNEVLSAADVTDLLGDIKQPTLVIHHKPVPAPTLAEAKEVASRIPNAQLVLLDSTWQSPGDELEHLMPVVEQFFGDLVSPSASPATSSPEPDVYTILFTDLVGHSEMMSRLGDERGRDLLREHERITREVLNANGGTEVKTMGDGFMASFGSVTKAVECAIALQRAFAERGGEPMSVRVGLNAGEPIEEDGDLFGATVILASRIAAKAEGGEILVADTVRGLCSGKGFLFADRGEFVAKGFEDPVRVYEVSWGT